MFSCVGADKVHAVDTPHLLNPLGWSWRFAFHVDAIAGRLANLEQSEAAGIATRRADREPESGTYLARVAAVFPQRPEQRLRRSHSVRPARRGTGKTVRTVRTVRTVVRNGFRMVWTVWTVFPLPIAFQPHDPGSLTVAQAVVFNDETRLAQVRCQPRDV
jgi:hypothetical protein